MPSAVATRPIAPAGAAPNERRWRQVVGAGPRVPTLVRQFEPIDLAELGASALLDRVDVKYAVETTELFAILKTMQAEYRVLEIDGRRLHRYQTLYYDTPDYGFYRLHHNGARLREKVRSRRYADSGLSFLEVKRTADRDRTIKHRLPVHGLPETLTLPMQAQVLQWVRHPAAPLEPKIANAFLRLTLAHKTRLERVTIDVSLRLWSDRDTVALPGLAIIEVKQDRLRRDASVHQTLRTLGLRPCSCSKYCLGVSMLCPQIKHNAFEPQLRMIHQLVRES